MGEVIHATFPGPGPVLTKAQLAQHPRINRSKRWIEHMVNDGMPSRWRGNERIFFLPDVLAWLESRERGVASG